MLSIRGLLSVTWLTLAALAALPACDGSGTSPPADAAPGDAAVLDAATTDVTGIPDAPDAAPPDAAPPDAASPDAFTGDAATGDAATGDAGAPDAAGPMLIVRAHAHHLGVADIAVVVGRSDGSVSLVTTTDALGVARVALAPDATLVTVVWHDDAFHAFTFVGVEPGDDLGVDIARFVRAPEPLGDVSAVVPDGAPDGTVSVTLSAGCAEEDAVAYPATRPLVVTTRADCHAQTTFPVLVTARDGAGVVLGYQVIPVTPPASVALAAWQVPPTGGVALYDSTGAFLPDAQLGGSLVTAGGTRFALPVVQAVSDAARREITFSTFPELVAPGARRFNTATSRLAGHAARYSRVDFSSSATFLSGMQLSVCPPSMLDLRFVAPGDPERPALAWSYEPDFTVPFSGAHLRVTWAGHDWVVVVPPGARGVQLPELPGPLAAWRPGATSVLGVQARIVNANFLFPGYATFRRFYDHFFELDAREPGRPGDATYDLPGQGALAFTIPD
jgi:hypothetical protein